MLMLILILAKADESHGIQPSRTMSIQSTSIYTGTTIIHNNETAEAKYKSESLIKFFNSLQKVLDYFKDVQKIDGKNDNAAC